MTVDKRELEGIKREMQELADHIANNADELDDCLDSDVVSGLLRELADGKPAAFLIDDFGLNVEGA